MQKNKMTSFFKHIKNQLKMDERSKSTGRSIVKQ